jgi:hypothetical protein
MQIKEGIGEVLHKMRVKLFPNYLKNVDGKYVARTESEKMLFVKDVCGTAITRGGVEGITQDKYSNLVDLFFEEAAYLMCDGYCINFSSLFSAHPSVRGPFNSPNEIHDHVKHPIDFTFRIMAKMRRLAQFIKVEIIGISDANAYIDEFIDYEANNALNVVYTPGDQFAIHGHKIKLAGADPGVGLFLVPEGAPQSAVKIARMAENSPSRLTGTLPASTGHGKSKLEIRTQYSGVAEKPLKTLRVITSPFTLEEV